jgi:hypothetical protein
VVTAYAFSAELWRYDGEVAWFFVSLPTELAEKIRDEKAPLTKGFGAIRVSVRIGSSTWDTSVFPDQARDTYLLPVKKSVRRAERLDVRGHDPGRVDRARLAPPKVGPRGPTPFEPRPYLICADSSWIFRATCLSLSACSLLWWRQKNSSDPLTMVTRTYA